MGRYNQHTAENEAVRTMAFMMASAARTAPKGNGVDDIEVLNLDGDDIEKLACVMDELSEQKAIPYPSNAFKTNAWRVRHSNCIMLIGVKGSRRDIERPLDCGACGLGTCASMKKMGRRKGNDFYGPTCVLKAIDLGIAIGSAAAMAGMFHVDNRIMYTIGAAAKKMELLESDVIIGIPMSVSGKSPYFERYTAGVTME